MLCVESTTEQSQMSWRRIRPLAKAASPLAAHLRRLIDQAGYEPTDWEREQLDRIRRDADEDAREGVGSDNDGITPGQDRGPAAGPEEVGEDEFVDPDDPEQNWIDAPDESEES
jgi:hypothetical protein